MGRMLQNAKIAVPSSYFLLLIFFSIAIPKMDKMILSIGRQRTCAKVNANNGITMQSTSYGQKL